MGAGTVCEHAEKKDKAVEEGGTRRGSLWITTGWCGASHKKGLRKSAHLTRSSAEKKYFKSNYDETKSK